MDKFEKILEIERAYRRNAKRIFTEYKKEESAARARLSPEAFKREFVLERWAKIAGNFRAETDSAVRKTTEIFNELRDELEDWMVKPVQPGILETLRCIREFGLRLSLQELRVIEQGVSESYLGKRLFASIANCSGFCVKDVSAEELLSALSAAQSIVEHRIRTYAGGEGFPGKDLIDHKIIDGVDWGEYSLSELAMSSIEPKSDNLDFVKKLWEKAKAPIAYTLTEEEAKNIAKKLDPLIDRWGDIDKKGAEKVREEMPDIISRLDSMPDSYANKEAFRKFYLLNHTGSENQAETNNKKEPESSLEASPSMEQAKEYADRRGTANMDILSQF